MFLPWNWEKQAYHHLGNESSNREKSHTSCERMTRNSLGRQNDGWHFDWNRCLLFSRPSGHQEKFFVSTTKKIKKMCFNVKYLNGICLSQLIGTSWEYFHHFFPEMQEVGRRLLSRTVCQIRGHCHINKLEVWTTWHARFSHTFVMPHF